ncbi:hypothetical protein [Bacteroides sp.]|nr:hypothetical protein [Bacteroides sp.]
MENKNVFEKEDQLSSEMDELLGGIKVTFKKTNADGSSYEITVEI